MPATNQHTPRFEHDGCPDCRFLGRSATGKDLYFCPQGGFPTLIARFGDEGGEYKSGLFMVGVDPDITEARDLAKAAGLLKNC